MAGLIRKELPAVMSPAPRTRGQRAQKKESPESSSLNSGELRQNGGYLLSHLRSTIGVAKLNFSVRNGKRWDLRAITTLISFLVSFPAFIQDTAAHIHKNQQYPLARPEVSGY